MKRISILLLFLILAGALTALYSSSVQIVDVFVCEQGLKIAETTAKARVSRRELYTVSYCTCQGVDKSLQSEVKDMECKPPRNYVYSCVCVGKNYY